MKTVVVKPEFAGLTEEQVIDAIDAYEAQVDEYYANKGDEEECGCGCSHDEGSCEDSDDDVIPSDDPIVLEVERLIAAYSDRFDELCKENGEVPEEALTYKPRTPIEQVAFDIFRFDEDGEIVEHWDNLAALAGENPSGHTQIDGTAEIADLDKTEENRELVENFLYDVMQGNNPDKTADYFDGDAYIQHNTAIADGVSGLSEALAAMAGQGVEMIYDEVHMVLAQGNFVLAVSEGTYGGVPTSYYDLWRVEGGKIAEHWDVMETIADQSTWQNQNGKF